MLSIRNNLPVPPRARARMWPELAGETNEDTSGFHPGGCNSVFRHNARNW
ncbi:hypothetical protein IWQ54_000385 [Labrenzia sp. EL_195]|nr:hypothetical protein [Labrenzia sp. EL_195]